MIKSPKECFEQLYKWVGTNGAVAFFATVVCGVITHMVALTSDIPNHDGLASMYFDQNMITSGRWFLGIACGITSFYSIPWLIGFLSLLYLGITSIFLCRLLKVNQPVFIAIVSCLLVTFPSLASNFAYVFTMDGYMLGLLLAVLAVYLVGVNKFGFLFGAVSLAFSMGIYQAYLPIAILLSLYMVSLILGAKDEFKSKLKKSLNYAYMGIVGVGLYYILLKILLAIQGKQLDTYQGIDGMTSASNSSVISIIKHIYVDFVSFSLKGNILFSNIYAMLATILLVVLFIISIFYRANNSKNIKSVWFYAGILALVFIVPFATNVILIISSNVTYHLLMRYQWVFLEIIMVAFIGNTLKLKNAIPVKVENYFSWGLILASIVIIFSYIVSDNIAYSNFQKKYEKTYAYCLRLADRIEQTEGYYQGIPIYLIGVISDEQYPGTDITANVTGNMIGLNGDYLIYTGDNYEQFFKYYLGITINILDPEDASYYYEKWYDDMPSFPSADSIRIVDGIMVIKTENL